MLNISNLICIKILDKISFVKLQGLIMSLLNILTKNEILNSYSPKELSYKEKVYYFTLPRDLEEKAQSFSSNDGKLVFILLYGYFKAFNQFFDQKLFLNNDIDFMKNKFDITSSKKIVSKSRFYEYQKIIKQHLHINDYTDTIKSTLQNEANNLANNFIHRKKIFYALINLSKKLNIETPSYTELTKIITIALNTQKKDILSKLELVPHHT